MMKVLKASAGSGKTYNLAKEYIKLLLLDREREDGRPYRHILLRIWLIPASLNY